MGGSIRDVQKLKDSGSLRIHIGHHQLFEMIFELGFSRICSKGTYSSRAGDVANPQLPCGIQEMYLR